MIARLSSRAPLAWALAAALLTAAGCASDEPEPPPPPAYTEVTPATEAPPPEPPPSEVPALSPPPETEAPPPAPPRQEPPPAPKPEPLPPEAPAPAGAARVTFVRVGELSVGGDFDSAGDEEVVVEVSFEGAQARLFERSLDLPDEALETFTFEESEWTELPEVAELSLDLSVVEADVTENETMCGSDDPVVVRPLAAGPDESKVAVRLSTIRGESSGLFKATKRFSIPGPSLELRLVRVPRRDAPDAAARQLVAAAYAGLDSAGEGPASPAEFTALRDQAAGWARQASTSGARSTHTWARKTLAALADETDELVQLLTAEPVGLDELTAARKQVADALEALGAPERATLQPASDEVAAVLEAKASTDAAELQVLEARCEAACSAVFELGDLPEPIQELHTALFECQLAAEKVGAFAASREKVGPALRALRAKVAAATGAR